MAVLALSDVSSSPLPQSFGILGGIFALFGFFYTIFLAFHIGDSKTQFSDWFLVRPTLTRTARPLEVTELIPGPNKTHIRIILELTHHGISPSHMDGLVSISAHSLSLPVRRDLHIA